MNTRGRRVAAGAIALLVVLALGGTALAAKTKFFPTVSINAHQSGSGHAVRVSGVYDRMSPKCHGPGGRSVSISANDGQSTTTTTRGHSSSLTGKYGKVTFGHFTFGHSYTFKVFVPGGVKSGYDSTTICYDASASQTVHFHS